MPSFIFEDSALLKLKIAKFGLFTIMDLSKAVHKILMALTSVLKRAIVFGIRNKLCQKVYPKRKMAQVYFSGLKIYFTKFW